MIKIKQIFKSSKLLKVQETIKEQLNSKEIFDTIIPGQRIAIGVGSRGIDNLDIIVKETVQFLKGKGVYPFIVPAMGSHGNSTAEGQKEILNTYRINEISMGVPIVSSMDTVELGVTESGITIFIDKAAYEADMIVPINRVKAHTDYKGAIESGLCKMLAIGLGNQKGCTALHEHGTINFSRIIPETGKYIIENAKVGFGVAIVEDSYDKTAIIKAIPASKIYEEEIALLKISKEMLPKIMIPQIDVLVVEEFGKNISGAGMDPNITGRTSIGNDEGFEGPDIKRIAVLDLTDESHGNACGISCADYITRKLFNKIDFDATYKNSIACYNPKSAQIPIIAENEEEALAMAVKSCQHVDMNRAKIVRIKDTLSLDYIYISESLIDAIKYNEKIQIIG